MDGRGGRATPSRPGDEDDRRGFLQTAGAGALGATLLPRPARGQAPAVAAASAFDVAVVGADVFGVCGGLVAGSL
jgi:hypothetical protein